jgi:Protein of unknown function (DUF3298)
MKSAIRKIFPGLVLSILLASMLGCGSSPTLQPTTGSLPVPPTEEVTEAPPAPATAVLTEPPPNPPIDASTPTFTPIPVYSVLNLVSNLTEESGKSPDYTIKAQTPFYQGSEDQRVTNFNNEMTLLTQEEIARFRDNLMQVQPMPGSPGSFYDQTYKILSPPGDLVSMKYQIMIYIQGAAHPGTHMRTVTYDLDAGSDVRMEQLFLPGSNYLERVANYCIGQLGSRNIGFESFSKGAQPLRENYGNWNITTDGLLITFDEYQVAAYAAGPQEVNVPYTELQSIIDPRGPLAGFLP